MQSSLLSHSISISPKNKLYICPVRSKINENINYQILEISKVYFRIVPLNQRNITLISVKCSELIETLFWSLWPPHNEIWPKYMYVMPMWFWCYCYTCFWCAAFCFCILKHVFHVDIEKKCIWYNALLFDI